jgi:hypothetical protein
MATLDATPPDMHKLVAALASATRSPAKFRTARDRIREQVVPQVNVRCRYSWAAVGVAARKLAKSMNFTPIELQRLGTLVLCAEKVLGECLVAVN